MANKILNSVFSDTTTAGAARLVLLALADRADAAGVTMCGTADIAARANLEQRYVRRLLRELEAAGHLVLRSAGCGRMRPNVYQVITGMTRAEADADWAARSGNMGDTARVSGNGAPIGANPRHDHRATNPGSAAQVFDGNMGDVAQVSEGNPGAQTRVLGNPGSTAHVSPGNPGAGARVSAAENENPGETRAPQPPEPEPFSIRVNPTTNSIEKHWTSPENGGGGGEDKSEGGQANDAVGNRDLLYLRLRRADVSERVARKLVELPHVTAEAVEAVIAERERCGFSAGWLVATLRDSVRLADLLAGVRMTSDERFRAAERARDEKREREERRLQVEKAYAEWDAVDRVFEGIHETERQRLVEEAYAAMPKCVRGAIRPEEASESRSVRSRVVDLWVGRRQKADLFG